MSRVSNMMRWPHYPFQFIVAFGSAMYAVVLFIQTSLRGMLRKHSSGDDEARLSAMSHERRRSACSASRRCCC